MMIIKIVEVNLRAIACKFRLLSTRQENSADHSQTPSLSHLLEPVDHSRRKLVALQSHLGNHLYPRSNNQHRTFHPIGEFNQLSFTVRRLTLIKYGLFLVSVHFSSEIICRSTSCRISGTSSFSSRPQPAAQHTVPALG